MKLNLKYHKQ